MAAQNEAPPGRAGPLDINSVAGSDIESSEKHVHVQEAIAALQRDFVAEALRIAGIKALHAADDITLGDDGCAERGIQIAIQNLREAATAFRQLQKLNDARSAHRRQEDSRPHEYQVSSQSNGTSQALAAFMQENRP
ncbi:MAG: hypothetical protein WA624_22750 [Methylocella sp.]